MDRIDEFVETRALLLSQRPRRRVATADVNAHLLRSHHLVGSCGSASVPARGATTVRAILRDNLGFRARKSSGRALSGLSGFLHALSKLSPLAVTMFVESGKRTVRADRCRFERLKRVCDANRRRESWSSICLSLVNAVYATGKETLGSARDV